MAATMANIFLFVYENRDQIGEQAPQIVINALESMEAHNGILLDRQLYQVMGRDRKLARRFQRALRQRMHVQIALLEEVGHPAEVGVIIQALFSRDEVIQFMEDYPDQLAWGSAVGEVLRAKGFDWKDRWFTVAP